MTNNLSTDYTLQTANMIEMRKTLKNVENKKEWTSINANGKNNKSIKWEG